MCTCRLDQACHADVILHEWDTLMTQYKDILTNIKRARLADAPQPRLVRSNVALHPQPAQPTNQEGTEDPTILLVELFAGIGTATFALKGLGVTTVTMATEVDKQLREFLQEVHNAT